MVEVRSLTGAALDAALDDVARLRIAVFRDWPYLYDGSLDYERRYLESYRASDTAVVVGAFDGAQLIGAAPSRCCCPRIAAMASATPSSMRARPMPGRSAAASRPSVR